MPSYSIRRRGFNDQSYKKAIIRFIRSLRHVRLLSSSHQRQKLRTLHFKNGFRPLYTYIVISCISCYERYTIAPLLRLGRSVTPRAYGYAYAYAYSAQFSRLRRSLCCACGPHVPNFRSALVLRHTSQMCTIGSDLHRRLDSTRSASQRARAALANPMTIRRVYGLRVPNLVQIRSKLWSCIKTKKQIDTQISVIII